MLKTINLPFYISSLTDRLPNPDYGDIETRIIGKIDLMQTISDSASDEESKPTLEIKQN